MLKEKKNKGVSRSANIPMFDTLLATSIKKEASLTRGTGDREGG